MKELIKTIVSGLPNHWRKNNLKINRYAETSLANNLSKKILRKDEYDIYIH